MTYDLTIIGGGPAAAAAGVYAARKQLKTIFITADFGGQSVVSPEIQNWVGDIAVSGEDLAKKLADHVKHYAGEWLTIREGEKVTAVTAENNLFKVETSKGEAVTARAVLVATGGRRRKLEVPGADAFDQKGLTYCASCDGPLFGGMEVAVIGGGNAGLESATQLLAYAKKVYLLHRHPEFKGDAVTIEKLSAHPNFVPLLNTEPTEVKGDKFVNALAYRDLATGEVKELAVSGIFVEIGFMPNTEFIKGVVDLTPTGAVVVDAKNQRASLPGIWAAGDCTDGLYHQNNIAAGDAVKALEDIYQWLHKN